MLKIKKTKRASQLKKKLISNSRGSVTIEATITFTISLFLLFLSVGTVFSILINERMHQIAMEVTGDLQGNVITYFDMKDNIKREAAEYTLEVSALNHFNEKLTAQHMDSYVKIRSFDSHIKSNMDDTGVFKLVVCYEFNIPTVLKSQELSYPIIRTAYGDGVEYESRTVYITRTGEKYHEDSCMHLRRSKIPIDIKNAKERGFEPCKNCHPQRKE